MITVETGLEINSKPNKFFIVFKFSPFNMNEMIILFSDCKINQRKNRTQNYNKNRNCRKSQPKSRLFI